MAKVDVRDEVFFDEKVKQTKLLRFIARAVGIYFVASVTQGVYIGMSGGKNDMAPFFIALSVFIAGVAIVVNLTEDKDK